MRSGRILFLLIIFASGFKGVEFPDSQYFQFPINPGKVNFLAGTMGELRRGHFHGGIDVKTAGQTGLPIYAAADGYISRISISPTGYGKRLNVTHPNGYITVYAHLEKFSPELENMALNMQYEKESYRIDYFPKKLEFPVKKGEIIAFSGNSGFSAAPHLHFEIRDEKNRQLNPLEFGFTEVLDSAPPIIQALKVIPKSASTQIDGSGVPKELRCYRNSSSGSYYIKDTLKVSGPFALEFKGYDKMSGNWNRTGIQAYNLYLDGKEVFSAKINSLPVLLTRFINLHVDFPSLVTRNRWFHRVHKETGNLLPFYRSNGKQGIVELEDAKPHELSFELIDAMGNKSKGSFYFRNDKTDKQAIEMGATPKDSLAFECKRWKYFLKIMTRGKSQDTPLYLYSGNLKFELEPSYVEQGQLVHLWDLRKMILDSITLGDQSKRFDHKVLVPPAVEFSFFSDDLQIDFFRKSLFDTVVLKLDRDSSSIELANYLTPLRAPIKVTWTISDTSFGRANSHAYILYGKTMDFVGGYWKDDKLVFTTKSFGKFTVAKDTVKPSIRYLGNRWGRLRFKIEDRMSGIKNYRGELNGEWIMMEFDAKKSILVSRRKEEIGAFQGDFKLVIEDQAGNKNEFIKKY